MGEEKLLNLKETAEFFGVSTITMRRKLGKKGKPGQKDRKAQIGSYKIGKLILFSMEKHILPYLNHCEEKAQQKSANRSNLIELPKQFDGGSSDE